MSNIKLFVMVIHVLHWKQVHHEL